MQTGKLTKVNKRVLETLIKSGAFDSLGGTRRAMLAFLPEAMRMAEQHHRDQLKGKPIYLAVCLAMRWVHQTKVLCRI